MLGAAKPARPRAGNIVTLKQVIAEVCLKHNVVLGYPHVTAKNHGRVLKEGYRFLMSAPQRSFGGVGRAREMAGY